ncbi:hypothetical protein ACQPXS_28475 [Streptomyces sp. CA-142005]|uniref:hypothetical protein n=1 Tax=Streptomyces sp. CA-142005 TaxID=3240052 RepID=UPI003D909134
MEVTVTEGRLFLLADHREVAADSRAHLSENSGTVAQSAVVGYGGGQRECALPRSSVDVGGRGDGLRILGFTSWSLMLDITFVPDSMRELTGKQLAKLARASEMDLRYEYFKMEVSITTDEFGSDPFPGAPALDFVFCVLLAAGDIRQGNPGRISFTENDLLIHLTRDGETVTVTRSWDSVPGHCTVTDFFAVASRFSREVLEFIVRRYPAFQMNPARGKLVGMVGELKAS